MLHTGRVKGKQPVGRKSVADGNKPKSRVNRKARARLADAPAPALMGLPRIPAGIPKELVQSVNAMGSAKIALALLDAGLLSELDMVNGNRHPVALIESSFKRWFERVSAPLSIFDLKLDMTDSVVNWESGFSDDEARSHFELAEAETVSFGVDFGAWDRFFLKHKVEEIEKVAPGLGKTAIERLESILYSSMFVVTPSFVEDAARYNYWGGSDDEGEYLAECCGSDEEREELLAEMITKADIQKLMPSLETKLLCNDEIIAFTESTDTLVASVAAKLLEMDDEEGYQRPVHADQISQDGSVCTDAGVWLQWQPDDMTNRIMDDWYQYVMECGNLSMCVFWMFELTSEKIAVGMKNMERYISRLIWAEQLLMLIGTLET